MNDLRKKFSKAEIYPFVSTPQLTQHIEDEAVKAVQSWLLEKYKTLMEGCGNPYCPFCLDIKEKKGMVNHIFEGYLLQYTVSLPQINESHKSKEGT